MWGEKQLPWLNPQPSYLVYSCQTVYTVCNELSSLWGACGIQQAFPFLFLSSFCLLCFFLAFYSMTVLFHLFFSLLLHLLPLGLQSKTINFNVFPSFCSVSYPIPLSFLISLSQKTGKERGNLPKQWRDLQTKGTNEHMEAWLKHFGDACVHIHLLSSDRERHRWSSKRFS